MSLSSNAAVVADYDLEKDCRGMRCPMPLLHTKLGLKKLNNRQILRILVTDTAYLKDLQFLLEHGQCELLDKQEQGEALAVYLRRLN